ncbi:MAG: hypothetical protein ACK4OM_07955, partial [Alphaproteobacteria bacterium]
AGFIGAGIEIAAATIVGGSIAAAVRPCLGAACIYFGASYFSNNPIAKGGTAAVLEKVGSIIVGVTSLSNQMPTVVPCAIAGASMDGASYLTKKAKEIVGPYTERLAKTLERNFGISC